jgi:hypothetical protein
LLLCAAAGELLLRHELPEPPARGEVRPGPLPHVTELIRQSGRIGPYIVVTTDRLGAAIHTYGRFGSEVTSVGVTGPDGPVRKVKVGGWRHDHIQRRSEQLWERGAASVAAEVDRLAADVDPLVVLVAGDVRARSLLIEHLGAVARDRVHVLDHPGGDEPEPDLVLHVVRETARGAGAAVLDRLRAELGREQRAAAGLTAVCAALSAHQVDTLVLTGPAVSEPPRLWVGPGAEVAVRPEDLLPGGFTAPADDALIRAAALTDAQVLVRPELADFADGVAALLRYR